ncbi:MAG: hypothetical protein CVV61_05730 [Tenericutes bacterium HGW-Tenericutes-6]|jgi:hypothetical protein|nr:MAG: hypothetical protein CVV61_05730 [Tenericutes bacterium HGW-Tenericutes-6]
MRKSKDLAIYFSNQQAGIYEIGVPFDQSFFGFVQFDKGLIENGYIKEPELVLQTMNAFFIKENIKPRKIIHILHDQNYLIRDIKIKDEDLGKLSHEDYIQSQIGKTIYLPYESSEITSIIREKQEDATRIIGIVSDAELLHAYHDIYDRLKAKEVHFEIAVLPQYKLYIKNHQEQQDETLMFVSIYDGAYSIQIIEQGIPIFNLIEDIEGGREEYVLAIENYVERIANYYKYNMRKGKKNIHGVVLFSLDPDYDLESVQKDFVKKLKSFKARVCEELLFNPLINVLPKVAIPTMAYAKSYEEDINYLSGFKLIRPKRSITYGNYINIIAFSLVAFMFLIYMPFYAIQEDIKFQQNRNNALQTQLNTLRDETPQNPNYSLLQQNYSNAYDLISAHEFSQAPHLSDLISLLPSDIAIINYQLRAEQKEIKFILTALNEEVLIEYALEIYETYGIVGEASETRWMIQKPATKFTQTNVLEVVINYA